MVDPLYVTNTVSARQFSVPDKLSGVPCVNYEPVRDTPVFQDINKIICKHFTVNTDGIESSITVESYQHLSED